MKITYNEEENRNVIDAKGTLILTKNKYKFNMAGGKDIEVHNFNFSGAYGRFGKLKQLITAIKFIFSK